MGLGRGAEWLLHPGGWERLSRKWHLRSFGIWMLIRREPGKIWGTEVSKKREMHCIGLVYPFLHSLLHFWPQNLNIDEEKLCYFFLQQLETLLNLKLCIGYKSYPGIWLIQPIPSIIFFESPSSGPILRN